MPQSLQAEQYFLERIVFHRAVEHDHAHAVLAHPRLAYPPGTHQAHKGRTAVRAFLLQFRHHDVSELTSLRRVRETQTDVGEKVIVFSITDEIPNDVVAVTSDLPQDLKDAIFDTIAAYLETEEGEAIFDEIYGWTDIARADEASFDIVRNAANTLGITEPID